MTLVYDTTVLCQCMTLLSSSPACCYCTMQVRDVTRHSCVVVVLHFAPFRYIPLIMNEIIMPAIIPLHPQHTVRSPHSPFLHLPLLSPILPASSGYPATISCSGYSGRVLRDVAGS
eukprot:3940790-Rhodomonas_salina.1